VRLDDRGRRASEELRRTLGWADEPDAVAIDRFEHTRRLRRRNQRIGAAAFASVVALAAVALAIRALAPVPPHEPLAPRSGRLIYGAWDQQIQQAEWFVAQADGSRSRALGITATCAVWFPDDARILITNDAALGLGSPLRPAVVRADGTGLRPLVATDDDELNLGCGDVSPDGRRIALEGFGQTDGSLDGIYTVRASDGGGLVRLHKGQASPPEYSPDGSRLLFFDTKPGVSPQGAGALFVMGSDGTGVTRITPWGFAFMDHAWSPDAAWIVFQRPYGELYLVRPDGTDLRRLPLRLPAGAGAQNPTWSPDGTQIVFSMQRADRAELWVVRPNGGGLRKLLGTGAEQLQTPDWSVSTG
jgi:Tol biopolymer transport system component